MTDMTSVGAGAAPAPLPVGVLADAAAAVAAFLRLADAGPADAETALLRRLAAVAIGMAEAFLGRALIGRAFEDVVVADGDWRALAAEPVGSIAGITALPAGAAPVVLPVDRYRIDIAADGRGWVQVMSRNDGGEGNGGLAAVAYTAGLVADWASVPPPIAQGVVAVAARLFVDRETASAPPPEVAALWRPFRRLRLAGGMR